MDEHSHTHQANPAKSIIWIAMLIGALQGIAGLATDTHSFGRFFPDTVSIAVFYAALGGGLCAQLLLKNPWNICAPISALGTGILFGATTWWSYYQLNIPQGGEDYSHGSMKFSVFMQLLMLAYILIPYLQNLCNRTVKKFDYQDLYRHSWDNFFIASIGILVSGIFWLLIFLWAELFEMLKINVFSNFFYGDPFHWIAPFAIAGLGITIGIRNEKIIDSLRNIALAICKFMMPLTALITIMFTATLPFTGLQAIWDTKHSTPILLTLIAANVFFINGIFQDGNESQYPEFLKKISNLSLLMLPALTVIAAYSTWLRIDQYGLTPDRIYSLLIILVGACYSFSYAFSAAQRNTQWLANIRKPNIYTGILICTLIALTHSPFLDPMTISAKNQYSRLINNKISADKFDFGALRYKLGKPGLFYLQKIRDLQKHENLSVIKEKIKKLDDTKNYYNWNQGSPYKNQHSGTMELIGGGSIPAGLSDAIKADGSGTNPNYLLLTDTNGDGQNEVLAWKSYGTDVWGLKNGRWVKIGKYNKSSGDGGSPTNIKELLSGHSIELQTPTHKNLKIGDYQWDFISTSANYQN